MELAKRQNDAEQSLDEQGLINQLRQQENALINPGQIMLAATGSQWLYSDWVRVEAYEAVEQRVVINKREVDKKCLWITFTYLCYDLETGHFINLVHSGLRPDKPQGEFYADFMRKAGWVGFDGNYGELMTRAVDLLDGKSADLTTELKVLSEGEKQQEANTQLMGRSNKQALLTMMQQAEERKGQVIILKKMMDIEVARRMEGLNQIRQQASALVAVMGKRIKRIMRLITVIELYVGVEEELHQLQSGESAPVDEPIAFRQLVLFMDEEISVKIGFEKARNFDFSTVEKFDEWLLQPGHLNYLLPELRGMVALRPRRTHKDYGYDDPFVNAMRNVPNMANTYFLIRMERIYTVFSRIG